MTPQPFLRSATSSVVQQDWANLAGQLMIEEGFIDYRLAKNKAAKQLQLSRGDAEPSVAMIETAALTYYETHREAGDIRWHIEQLAFARESLSQLQAYEPKLAGTLLKHRPNALGEIDLHINVSTAEVVLDNLYARSLAVTITDKRCRLSNNTVQQIPTYKITVGDFIAAIVVFTEEHCGLKQLSAVTLRPIQPWSHQDIDQEILRLTEILNQE